MIIIKTQIELYQEEEKEENLTTHQTKPADLLEHTVDSDSDPDCLGYFQEASSGSDHEVTNYRKGRNEKLFYEMYILSINIRTNDFLIHYSLFRSLTINLKQINHHLYQLILGM